MNLCEAAKKYRPIKRISQKDWLIPDGRNYLVDAENGYPSDLYYFSRSDLLADDWVIMGE